MHTREAEAWFILDGTMTYLADGKLVDLAAGDFIYLPRGVPHGFRTTGSTPVRFLALAVPGQLLDLYDEVGSPADGAANSGRRCAGRGYRPLGRTGAAVRPADRRAAYLADSRTRCRATAFTMRTENHDATSPKSTSQREAERLVREQFRIIETGELDLAEANVTPGYVNHRSVHEPLAARSGGPDALKATAGWLRRAFSDLRFDIHDITVIDDRVIAWVTLHGRNTGPFVVHDSPDGSVTDVFPPTGRGIRDPPGALVPDRRRRDRRTRRGP